MDTIIGEILACLRAWEPAARVLGNVRAQDAIEAIERLVAELAESQEKAMRFDLDRAGIERREQEATELVTLRAELAECKMSLGAIHAMVDRVSTQVVRAECERAVPELAALAAKEKK